MRTTVTLDPDTEQLLRHRMASRGVSFKQALNDAIRESAGSRHPAEPFVTMTRRMGPAKVGLDRALQVAAELEDDALGRKLAERR